MKSCDELAAGTDDPDRPKSVKGVKLGRIEASAAIEACRAAASAYTSLRRLDYQLGRAYDRAERAKEAFAAYDRSAKAGSFAAMNNLATLYEYGQGMKGSRRLCGPDGSQKAGHLAPQVLGLPRQLGGGGEHLLGCRARLFRGLGLN
ncbi:hypothetical protein [Methylorubrum extorquens]|uniref:Peptidase C14 caspase catalytic subunit P20 n=1 Tax=Methylorubrum extorquens (strain CM4 / NCIMB 13688) TaxID=440085 RepID=B7KRN1_METC4|nr:hypothetical protein [Methylorubrum extorquens]ACK85558.1 peptidase C14 caspase catalytic subunit P20 [Methylorubrum extorquens CM4]